MKRILVSVLAALMLVSTFASCGNDNGNTDDTGSHETLGEGALKESLDIPDTKYNGMELIFLTRDEGEWSTTEIFAEKANEDNISNAVYERNDMIREKYDVIVKEFKEENAKHNQKVQTEVKAPTGDFSVIISSTSICSSLATNGCLWNLNSDEIEYLDFSKSWWDQKLVEGMSIGERLHFATGDLLTADNDATFAILFNKSLATDAQLPNLYELVDSNQWTMDKFYEFEQTTKQDKDGNGKLEYNSDICGFAYTTDSKYCFLYAGGVKVTEKDENDEPVYTLDVGRADDIADKCRLIFSKEFTVDMNNPGDGADVVVVGQDCFGGSHALFFGECMQCVTRMRGFDIEFGILPYPMYDAKQSGYHSVMHMTGSVVAIPRSISEKSKTSLVMVTSMIEAMACYAQPTLTEQYYEINLKSKHSKDPESGPMIDKILANRVCDLAYYYSWGDGIVGQLGGAMLPDSNVSVASKNQTYKRSVEGAIKQTLKKFEKADKN